MRARETGPAPLTPREQKWPYSACKYDLRVTDELLIILEYHAEWSEVGKRWKLEEWLHVLLDDIELAIHKRREERLENEQRRPEWQAEQERAA